MTQPYASISDSMADHRSNGAIDNGGWAKLDFVATVSHEIRTPVNSILGLSRLLLESDIGSEPLAWAQMIQSSATRLLEIVNDILDISKLEAGRVELNETPYVVQELLDTVLDALRPKALEKNIRLTGSISSSLPAALRGDVRRLGQILFNLVGNAIKFTDRGQVTVEIGLFGAPAGGDRKMRLRVLDTGIGIPPDALPALFEKFTQADTSISRRFGGTGLGLAICRELAVLMGGHISAASVLGQGSCFSVVLPLQTHADNQLGAVAGPLENQRPAMGKTQWRGRVLIAEDNDINRYIVVTALRKAGFHVTAVANGIRAVDAARQQDFDLILMDMQMPEMDGPQATRLIRALPERRGALPIVALTANAMAGVREQCLAIGMNAYLTKPIDPRRLVDFVATTIVRSQEERACAQPARQRVDEDAIVDADARNEVRELLGEQSWQEMVRSFTVCLPAIRDQAGCLLATHAYARLGALMHQLVSSAGTLGLRRLESLARRMEETIRCQRYEGLPELWACLNEETTLALTALALQTRAEDKAEDKKRP